MGGSKKSGSFDVAQYYMSMHIGVCATAPNIEILNVKIGDKIAWSGSMVEPDVVAIDRVDMFGGDKKEGGVKGALWWLPGSITQRLPPPIFSRFGFTKDTAPGFRGLASFVLTGVEDTSNDADWTDYPAEGLFGKWRVIRRYLRTGQLLEDGEPDAPPPADPWYVKFVGHLNTLGNTQDKKNAKGFYLASNNPYLRTISARVRRAPLGLNPAIALIRLQDNSAGEEQYAANAIHIIYECMTNRDWGMGENSTMFDLPKWEDCAQKIYDEGFGLNMIWREQSEIGQFVGEVLDHIQAVVYVDPTTGLHTVKLLRDDYDVEDLVEINPSNAKLSDFRRKSWGEITNEVTVVIKNPETGQDESYTAQDLAGIAAQGGIIPTTKNYYAICSPDLAMRVAERDLSASVQPIATAEATVSRAFWDTVNGDVVKLSWPRHGIESLPCRVSVVGKTKNNVSLSLYEDIFGLEKAEYLTPGTSGWENPNELPAPLDTVYVGTAPALMVVAALGLNDASEIDYPQALPTILPVADSLGDIGYDLTTWLADVNGTPYQDTIGSYNLIGSWVLDEELPAETISTLATLPGLRGSIPLAGAFLMIGNIDDATNELATVQSIDAGTTILRGVLDSVPRVWPLGTRVFILRSFVLPDPTIRAVGESVDYWIHTRTTLGVLPLASSPLYSVTLTDRAHLPLRPANVQVEGESFSTVDLSATTTFDVTWVNRNRLTEATQVMRWTDADTTPEAGQTTVVQLLDASESLIIEYDGLTGTSLTVDTVDFGIVSSGFVRVLSRRDGFESLQGFTVAVTL